MSSDNRYSSLSIWRVLPGPLIGAALLVFLVYLAVYFVFAKSLFEFPFDYDQGEGYELVDTIMFSEGKWPYQDIDSYPFYSSNYPPVYHLATVPLVWLFGPEYWTGRLVSFIATLVTSMAIGYAVQRESKRWWLAVLSGLLFLASNYVYHVGPLFRQHMFMVMLETLAIVALTLVIQQEEKSGETKNRGLLTVMILLLLAGYTKQLAYATVAAVFIFLFLRNPKRAVKWAIPFAIIVVLIFAGINFGTDGQWLINTITANVNPFIPGQAFGLFQQWFNLHTVLIFAASILAVYQLYFERLSAYAIWFVCVTVNAVTAGTWGAGESYFTSSIAAGAILTGLAFGRVMNWSATRGKVAAGLSVAFIILLYLVQADKLFHMPTDTRALENLAVWLDKPTDSVVAVQTSCSDKQPPRTIRYVDAAGVGLLGKPPTSDDTDSGEMITEWILAGETAAFSEEAGFNLYAKRDVVTNPTQLLNLYNSNQVDLTEMIQMLKNREFDSAILRAQFYPPPVLEALGQNYEYVDLIEMNGFVYCILIPIQEG